MKVGYIFLMRCANKMRKNKKIACKSYNSIQCIRAISEEV